MSFDDWLGFEEMGSLPSEPCPICHGKGVLPDADNWCGIEPGGAVRCPSCRGTGLATRTPSSTSDPVAGST